MRNAEYGLVMDFETEGVGCLLVGDNETRVGSDLCAEAGIVGEEPYNADEEALYLGVERGVCEDVRQVLAQGKMATRLRNLTDYVYEQTDCIIDDIKRRLPPPVPQACSAGCAWCCHLRVEVTVPEAIRIADYLREGLSPEAFSQVREQIARVHAQTRGLDGEGRAAAHLPCPLLANGLCSVYAVRPLKCRGGNSFDAGKCERYCLRPTRERSMPVYILQYLIAQHAQTGLMAGLYDAGMEPEVLELAAALHVALDAPHAAERWLAGEPVFGPARRGRARREL